MTPDSKPMGEDEIRKLAEMRCAPLRGEGGQFWEMVVGVYATGFIDAVARGLTAKEDERERESLPIAADAEELKRKIKCLESGLVNLRLYCLPHDHKGQEIITHFLKEAGSTWAGSDAAEPVRESLPHTTSDVDGLLRKAIEAMDAFNRPRWVFDEDWRKTEEAQRLYRTLNEIKGHGALTLTADSDTRSGTKMQEKAEMVPERVLNARIAELERLKNHWEHQAKYLEAENIKAARELDEVKALVKDYESGNLPTWREEYETYKSICDDFEVENEKLKADLGEAQAKVREYADKYANQLKQAPSGECVIISDSGDGIVSKFVIQEGPPVRLGDSPPPWKTSNDDSLDQSSKNPRSSYDPSGGEFPEAEAKHAAHARGVSPFTERGLAHASGFIEGARWAWERAKYRGKS